MAETSPMDNFDSIPDNDFEKINAPGSGSDQEGDGLQAAGAVDEPSQDGEVSTTTTAPVTTVTDSNTGEDVAEPLLAEEDQFNIVGASEVEGFSNSADPLVSLDEIDPQFQQAASSEADVEADGVTCELKDPIDRVAEGQEVEPNDEQVDQEQLSELVQFEKEQQSSCVNSDLDQQDNISEAEEVLESEPDPILGLDSENEPKFHSDDPLLPDLEDGLAEEGHDDDGLADDMTDTTPTSTVESFEPPIEPSAPTLEPESEISSSIPEPEIEPSAPISEPESEPSAPVQEPEIEESALIPELESSEQAPCPDLESEPAAHIPESESNEPSAPIPEPASNEQLVDCDSSSGPDIMSVGVVAASVSASQPSNTTESVPTSENVIDSIPQNDSFPSDVVEASEVSETSQKQEDEGSLFKGVDPRDKAKNQESYIPALVDLIYWRDVKKTGVVFGTMMTVMLCLAIFSLVSVLAYLSLALLTVSFSFVVYKKIMGAVQKTSDGHPFKQLLEMDISLNEDKLKTVIQALLDNVNKTVSELRRLFFIEDIVDSIKFGLLLWVLTYVGCCFNGITMVILAVISLFSLPKVYETYQVQIDNYVGLAKAQINSVLATVQNKLPFLKKKEKSQ